MSSKWAGLKGKLPPMPPQGENPLYVDRLIARTNYYVESYGLHDLTAALNTSRDKRDLIEQESKALGFEIDAMNAAILRKLEDQGLDRVTANGYTYTPSPEPYPQVTDKPTFLAWVNEHMPENLMLPYPTLAALVKKALEPGGSNEIPPGIDLYLRPNLRRTKAR